MRGTTATDICWSRPDAAIRSSGRFVVLNRPSAASTDWSLTANKSRSWLSASWRVNNNIIVALLGPSGREKILTHVGAAGKAPQGRL
jgi:hypothetical protein